MKKILILGATGTAGRALTQKLLADTDCRLTLFSRHARDVYTNSSRVTVVNGDAEDPAALSAVLPGQDAVYCAISGDVLPCAAENIVAAMEECEVKRLIFMAAVGIYNEIPEEIDGDGNLDREPAQIPNRKAAGVVKASGLNYTVLHPGYLGEGDEVDFALTRKGEAARGYTTPIPALVKLAAALLLDDALCSRESISITRDGGRNKRAARLRSLKKQLSPLNSTRPAIHVVPPGLVCWYHGPIK